MSEIKVEYHQDALSRGAHIGYRTVSVYQHASASDFKMGNVVLGWSSPLRPDIENAKRYRDALTKAIEIAELWEKDAGRDYKEVLQEKAEGELAGNV